MEIMMKENTLNEMNPEEMDQVNGGLLPILLGLGTIAIGGLLIAVMPDKKKE